MTRPAQNSVNTLQGGDVRIFVQIEDNPSAAYLYYGCLMIGGAEQSEGEVTPIYCPSPTRRNGWDIVGKVKSMRELGTADFTQRMDRYLRDAWWDLRDRGCSFNMQAVIGSCQSPDNFNQWDSKIVFQSCNMTSFTLPDLNPLEGGDNAGSDLTGSVSFEDLLPIRAIKFSEKAAATILAEVLDGIFNDYAQCGECGPASDGCQKAYFLTLANAGSPGLSSQVVYTANGGGTSGAVDIQSLGGKSGNAIRAVSDKLVVISQAGGNHHHALITDVDAGTAGAWTAVSGGYVATKGPRAMYVRNAAQVFIAAAGGYIYLMTDPTVAVSVLSDGSVSTQDLNDISGYGQTVVAVGGNNAVLVSENEGDSFGLVVGPEPGIGLNAIEVVNRNVWFVGTANGHLYYTLNAGVSWTQILIPSSVTVVNDIRFVNNVVGYMAVQIGLTAAVYRTTDNGRTWSNTAPSISSLPSAERINFVAPCNENLVAAGGRKTAGGDGLLAIAN